jgi:hypothetical protein
VAAKFSSPTSPTSEVTLPQVGEYTFKLTANDGKQSSSDTVKIVRLDHYRVETKTWIPQFQVVDPLHFLAEHWVPADSCWFDEYTSGTLPGNPPPDKILHISYFNGNNHRDYDGNPEDPWKTRVWVEFDWDGTNMTNKQTMYANDSGTNDLGAIGHTKRYFSLRTFKQESFTNAILRTTRRLSSTQISRILSSDYPPTIPHTCTRALKIRSSGCRRRPSEWSTLPR